MTLLLGLMLTLVASGHEPQVSGPVTGVLTVTVPERLDRSAPRAVLEVRLTGPQTLIVEPVRLGDAVRAWSVTRATSREIIDDQARVVETLTLEQTRPGLQPIPGVRVRFQTDREAPAKEFEWPDPLGPLKPIPVDLFPPPPTTNRLPAILSTGAILAGFVAFLVWRLTRRPGAVPILTPEEIATRELTELTRTENWTDPRSAATRLNAALRTWLASRTGHDLHARTIHECLDLLRTLPQVASAQLPALEAILTWCDTARFGAPSASDGSGTAYADQALRLISSLILR